MINFKKIAQTETTLSKLMEGRTKGDFDELIGTAVTVVEFDLVNDGHATYPCIVTKEHPDKFYFGGYVLNKIIAAWVAEEENGDVEAASEALKRSGGVRMGFDSKKTKNNNNVTTVVIYD